MVMYPTYSRPVEFEVIARARNFTDMHPTMKERLQALMEGSGGKVGWGQGVRTPQQQLQLFLERHSLDPQGTIVWNGEKYSRHTGAPAAPPGRSMHGRRTSRGSGGFRVVHRRTVTPRPGPWPVPITCTD